MHQPRSTARRGPALLVVAAIAFSTAGLFARKAGVDAPTMVFWRNLFGAAALLPVMRAATGPAPFRLLFAIGPWGWATVIASACATTCFLAAFAFTSVADVAVIYAAAPLLTAVIAWVWLREPLEMFTLGGALLAVVGVGVTLGGSLGGGGLVGDGLALAMTLAMALSTVFARRHGRLPALPTALLTTLLAAAAALPLGLRTGSSFAISLQAAAWLAGFGVVTMAVALPCALAGLASVTAARAMLIGAAEMPLAPLWVWLVIGETPSRAAIVGGTLVGAGVLAAFVGGRTGMR